VLRGCERADMQRIMVENGFDPVFARHAIEIIGGIGERAQDLPEDERAAVGLQGARRQRYQASPIRLISQLPRFTVADREVELAAVMSNPNIAVIRGLLSDEECDEVIRLSRGKMKTSQVVDRELHSQPRASGGWGAIPWSSRTASSRCCASSWSMLAWS